MLNNQFGTHIFYDADDGKGGGAADPGNNTDPNAETDKGQDAKQTFEAWLEEQDDKVKELYESNVSGLKSALQSERDAKKELSSQLKELLPKAEKGSELEKQLTEMANKAEAAERRALFAEEAIKPEIGCRNVKVAYALAIADDLFDKRGNPDWDEIKKIAPELFGSGTANANPGAGTNKDQKPKGQGMNEWIRSQAGK
jgi:hypothetical protein